MVSGLEQVCASSGTSVCHWVGWEILMRSQRPSHSLQLASDDSSYITGIELFVGGGLAQI